ncbi:hypothetical protein GBA52_027474 [Prunus armeniaca]|nr:hypothetical protein GBA52_027474 [Prunus armeniaca]
MGSTSKDLLQLEHKKALTSPIESTLLVCKNDSQACQTKKAQPEGKPIGVPVIKSQVLGKIRDFLGVISEANERLEKDAKVGILVLHPKLDCLSRFQHTFQIITCDLMLGVADLQTPEAVAAAESAISGYQPVIPLAVSSSEEESQDSSDNNSSSDEDDDDSSSEEDESDDENKKTSSPVKLKTPKSDKDDSSDVRNSRSKKRPKIVELP